MELFIKILLYVTQNKYDYENLVNEKKKKSNTHINNPVFNNSYLCIKLNMYKFYE